MKRKLNELFGKGKKTYNKVRKTFPKPDDLIKGDVIKLLHITRFCNIDGDCSLIRKLLVDEIVTYRGRAKNKLWSNNNIWIKLETADGILGIVSPVMMINNFEYEEEE